MPADALRVEKDGVEIESLVAAGAVPGVAVLFAAGRNGTGSGYLRTNAAGDAIQWKAPGSAAYGPEVPVPADGIYLLRDGASQHAWVRVQVWTAHLVAGRKAEVELRDVFGNDVGHDDVSAAEADAGDVASWTLTLRNSHDSKTLSMVRCWLVAVGLELSTDGASWSAPASEAAALALPDLAPEATTTLHVRRTIAAGSASDADVLNLLRFRYEA